MFKYVYIYKFVYISGADVTMFRIKDGHIINRMMGVMALWLISKRERSGYEIIKIYRGEKMPHMAAPSRIYPLLKKMEKDGLVKKKAVKGRRKSYVYTATRKGTQLLKFVSSHLSSGIKGEFLREMIKPGNGGLLGVKHFRGRAP